MNENILKLIDGNTWVTSDHHHRHKQIEEFEPSRIHKAIELGFDSYEDMLVHNHNQLVKQDDIVLFLGDFSFSSPAPHIRRYNGQKILIVGNHDTRGNNAYESAGFDAVIRGIYVNFNDNIFHCKHKDKQLSMLIMDIKNHRCALTHYPLGFNDSYNKQNQDGSYSIQDRMNYSLEIARDFDVDTIIHGHLHSKLATGNEFKYINVCVEHTDFKPIKIKDLLDLD